jgi:16S rRNA processing protein RimM
MTSIADAGGDPPFVVVGQVSKPHGTKGELFIWPLTDRPETTFVPGVRLQVADSSGNLPDEGFPPMDISAGRAYRRGYLVSVEGIDDRNAADPLHGRYLLRPFAEVEPAGEDEIFYHRLLGLRVVTMDGEEVGEVLEVHHMEPADLLEVSRGDRTVLIPFRREIVERWDLDAGVLVLNPPEGLLDL